MYDGATRYHPHSLSVMVCAKGGVLSPYSFTRYIRDMIRIVTRSNVGCIIDGQIINLLAFDLVTMRIISRM